MKVIVLGAGIAGSAAAYFVSRNGHDVTLLERNNELASECSHANGGQLSYSHAEPWANPAALKKIIPWMFKKDAPLVFRPCMDPDMWAWSFKFLRNCNKTKSNIHTLRTLRLALYSREILRELRLNKEIDFAYREKGIIHIFKKEQELQNEIAHAQFQAEHGTTFQVLSVDETLEKEPALKQAANSLAGSIYYDQDETGDINLFCNEIVKDEAVDIHLNTEIKELVVDGDIIKAVKTNKGDFEADKIIVATGAYSGTMLKKIGIKVPIYPMKGYSISIPVTDETKLPEIGLTDQSEKIVYSRLKDILRVAGTAEFAGFNHQVKKQRIASLKRLAMNLFPEGGDYDNILEWACLRPQTPDGCAVIGKTKYKNLILNTGHGTLGWTLGAGSAKIVSDLVDDKEPAISLEGLTVERFK